MSRLLVADIPEMLEESYAVDPAMSQMLWGQPGIGKTEAVYQFARRMKQKYADFFCKTYITSQMESIDYSMPYVIKDAEGRATYIKLPIADFVFPADARGIIFFDELPNAAPDVQKATQSIQSDRKIGELRIPDGVMITAAGNRKEDRAGSNGLLSALANRLEHYNVEASFDGWFNWALRNGVHHSIISYLKVFPQNLHNFKADRNTNATPRIWGRLSKYMHYYEQNASDFVRNRVESMVGGDIAGEFMQHMRCFQKFPTKEEIIANPKKAKLPAEPDVQYALSIAVFNWLGDNKEHNQAMCEYLMRFNLEYQGMVFKQAKEIKPRTIHNQKAFTDWARDHMDLLAS